MSNEQDCPKCGQLMRWKNLQEQECEDCDGMMERDQGDMDQQEIAEQRMWRTINYALSPKDRIRFTTFVAGIRIISSQFNDRYLLHASDSPECKLIRRLKAQCQRIPLLFGRGELEEPIKSMAELERIDFECRFTMPEGVFWNTAVEQYDGLSGIADDAAEIYHAQWMAWKARGLLARGENNEEH